MDTSQAIRDGLRELSTLALRTSDLLGPEIERAVEEVWATLNGGGRLFFCGNGGSAADAQHLAAEYVVRFALDRRALPALALTTDTSVLTAAGNDLGFERIFARQLEALARRGDTIFLHSTSGESENLIHTADAASALGVYSVGLLAKGGGRLAEMVDLPIVVPTESTARAQELHLALGHLICQLVEERFPKETSEPSR